MNYDMDQREFVREGQTLKILRAVRRLWAFRDRSEDNTPSIGLRIALVSCDRALAAQGDNNKTLL